MKFGWNFNKIYRRKMEQLKLFEAHKKAQTLKQNNFSLLYTSIASYWLFTGSPQSFIRFNSAYKIPFNDQSIDIMSVKSLMLFKELTRLVVQLVAREKLSFLSTTLSSVSRERSPGAHPGGLPFFRYSPKELIKTMYQQYSLEAFQR